MEVCVFLFRHPFRLSGVYGHRVLTSNSPRAVLQWAHSHRHLRTRYVCRQKGNRKVDHQTSRTSDLHGNRYRPLVESDGAGLWVARRSLLAHRGLEFCPFGLCAFSCCSGEPSSLKRFRNCSQHSIFVFVLRVSFFVFIHPLYLPYTLPPTARSRVYHKF